MNKNLNDRTNERKVNYKELDEEAKKEAALYVVPVITYLIVGVGDLDTIMKKAFTRDETNWCEIVDVEVGKSGEEVYKQVSRDGKLYLKLKYLPGGELRDDQPLEILTRDKLLLGIRIWTENEQKFFQDSSGYVDFTRLTNEEADEILQYALFSEVRYKDDFTVSPNGTQANIHAEAGL